MEEEQFLTSSDTDSESSSSNDESSATAMEVDDVASVMQTELHLMSFLKRVFKEAGSFADDDFRLLTVAVHAVMLHYGFVCFVTVFPPPNRRGNSAIPSTIRVTYTLPEVLDRGLSGTEEAVILFFENSENFVNIRGSLSDTEPVIHQLSLNRNRFAPPLDLAFVNSDMIDARIKLHGSSSDQYPENEIFEFCRLVNDALVYPLLIDLRQKAGLLLPPCFMRLPHELKLKILESLDGVEIARVACVCSELRNLCADDDLWKAKCAKEFGFEDGSIRGSWKNVYEHGHMLASDLNRRPPTGQRRRRFRGRLPLPRLLQIANWRFSGDDFSSILRRSLNL